MERFELIRLAVLLEISDDYEEPRHVLDRVASRLRTCQVAVAPEDVRASLTNLVESGLAQAYWLSGREPAKPVQGLPPSASLDDYYFWITDEGKRALAISRKEWPLDDEDQLLQPWKSD